VGLRAIGGERVMICHVTYAPGTTVRRHAHETGEQVMWIVDGAVTMTIGDETKELVADDVVVVNPGIEHERRLATCCSRAPASIVRRACRRRAADLPTGRVRQAPTQRVGRA
jgi:uncharacterized cupin superfamily protein